MPSRTAPTGNTDQDERHEHPVAVFELDGDILWAVLDRVTTLRCLLCADHPGITGLGLADALEQLAGHLRDIHLAGGGPQPPGPPT